MTIPSAPLQELSDAERANQARLFGSEQPLQITVISYTNLECLTAEGGLGKLKCIPFLAYLCLFATAGHSVVVFEGHAHTLEAALREADVLMVDSAMLPFVESGWSSIAARVMRTGSKQFICRREQRDIIAVAPWSKPPGWRYREPDGEVSYANCLLTILAKRPGVSVHVTAGARVPELIPLARDPDDAEWAQTLPFMYDRLDASSVINMILRMAGHSLSFPRLIPGLKSRYLLHARLAHEGGTLYTPFLLVLSGFGQRKTLEITREPF